MRKSILTFIILALSLTCLAQAKENVLKVKGNAILYQIPEIMYVNIPIQVSDSLYENCSFKLAQIHKELKQRLIKNGIKKSNIKTDDLSIGEKTKWTREGRIPDGFQGSVSMKIEMTYSLEKLSVVINTLKDEVFNFGYNVNFGLSEEQKSKTLEKSIELAINDAQVKASIIAKKLNIKLLEIKEINFGYSAGDFDILTPEDDVVFCIVDEDQPEETIKIDINPKKIKINKTINVIWKIER
ncbi:hypothetical protein BZG02_18995 [Labilibaculum filiforme]|uniref:SIMPL domain-containing protein n=1 Tax=Labilibaculum filiforme TaxID=1940526 RepID=A0A2N3HR76_9BACT|nr:SIMPL domain-containing protein [Labilibaculum filiforme]PKQ60553.1 hypothetical protein BZG02_18995 [Labilibaculum filiforme]